MTTAYFVTGANRGIGYALVKTLAQRKNTLVFAGARDPHSESLVQLSAAHPSAVFPVKYTLGNEEDNRAAIAEIERTAGRLDVIIANAAIANSFGPVATVPISEIREHWEANTLGMVVLFQAAHKLLLASPTGAPVFAYITAITGSIGAFVDYNAPAYGASKAAAHYFVKAMDAENPALISMAIHPGWVATDMGNGGAKRAGMERAPTDVQTSVDGILGRVDGATRERSSGRFWNFKAMSENPWDVATEEIQW